MHTRTLGPYTVSALGFGCMHLSAAYGDPLDTPAAERVIHTALDAGHTLFDTAAFYGFGANEELVGRALAPRRHDVVIASKCGLFKGPDGKRAIDGRPETLRATCEGSLRRLGTDVLDLYFLHRRDAAVPIEDSVGALGDLVTEGKVRAIGLSEVSADTLRRAHAVHPIAAVQSEYSLWTREPEIAVLEACRALGVAFVAFSPQGRGFLTGALRDVSTLAADDIRRSMPRFAPAAYAANLALLDRIAPLARDRGCTLGQLALAWLLAKGEDIVPIPSSTRPAHIAENAAAADIRLDAVTVATLDAVFAPDAVQGARYHSLADIGIDTETF